MIFTLYYVTATIFQSWRLKTISSKISKHLSTKASVVFYNVDETDLSGTPLSSDLCANQEQAAIQECLYFNGRKRGCAVVPHQNIFLGAWIEFPAALSLVPVNHKRQNMLIDKSNEIHLLIETEIMPMLNYGDDSLMMENFGTPIAWKVDSRIAFLLKSDLKHFAELINSTFLHDQFLLNDRLPILRIESVSINGKPHSYDMLKHHSKKESLNRIYQKLNKIQWERHIDELRQLSVLANQATEFEYNRNRTEGKTGVIKPDLIPSKNVQTSLLDKNMSSPESDVPLKDVVIESNSLTSTHLLEKSPEKKKINQNISQTVQSINTVVVAVKTKESQVVKDKKPPISNINKCEVVPSTSSSSVTQSTFRPTLKRTKKGGKIEQAKPPNILVYSDSNTTKDNVIHTLQNMLESDIYTIYPLSTRDLKSRVWIDNVTLLVVCGNVPKEVQTIILDYFLHGGKMFCLCSDVLHIILPAYRIAEVREHELVQFNYGQWKQVKLMHHIFCYQPSPVKKQFSTNEEEQSTTTTMHVPKQVEVCDHVGGKHNLSVQILGTEETWKTPSLMMAKNCKTEGICVFSQIHLEINPSNYENSEPHYKDLLDNEQNRVEIFADLLRKHLGLAVSSNPSTNLSPYGYGYFLGKYEHKLDLLTRLKPKMDEDHTTIQNVKLRIKFCNVKNIAMDVATENFLPILTHTCPDNFDTVKYFEILKTENIGRLVIYSSIMTSSMDVIQKTTFSHGFVVIPRQQTKGSGRGQNTWLSPEGCLMFSLQLHISLTSLLGQHVSLIQHLISSAVVKAILTLPGYEDLDIRLKWPNDIYANGSKKIGGNIVNSIVDSSKIVCNIGIGINLSNSNPTICLNDLVKELNLLQGEKLSSLQYEHVLAIVFNEIEDLYEKVQTDGLTILFDIYYKYWLHSEQQVTIIDGQGNEKLAKIIGIDNYGFLEVQLDGQQETETVHPDGNSFDMLRGLILPKL